MGLQSIENGRRVSLGKDDKAMVDADAGFHHDIYVTSGNPLIAEDDWARAGELSDVHTTRAPYRGICATVNTITPTAPNSAIHANYISAMVISPLELHLTCRRAMDGHARSQPDSFRTEWFEAQHSEHASVITISMPSPPTSVD